MSVSNTEKLRANAHDKGPLVKYLVRRETHSSRALASTLLALLLIIGLVYVIVEGVLSLSNHPKLLVRPHEMWAGFTQITAPGNRVIVTVVAIALILLGLWLLAKALLPGRLGRHAIADERVAYVVDDGVIASDISRKTREAAIVPAGQVTTGVSAHSVEVTVVPTSGHLLDQAKLQRQVRESVDALELRPRPKTRLIVSENGKVAK